MIIIETLTVNVTGPLNSKQECQGSNDETVPFLPRNAAGFDFDIPLALKIQHLTSILRWVHPNKVSRKYYTPLVH